MGVRNASNFITLAGGSSDIAFDIVPSSKSEGSKRTMVWIWTNPPSERGYPYADFDYESSTIDSSDISISKRILAPSNPSEIVVKLDRGTKNKVSKLACLPNVLRCPLVDDVLCAYINRFAHDDVEFLPVTLKLREKNESMLKFSYAHPLFHISGLDLEKSSIDRWLIPNEVVHLFTRLVFKAECLAGRHYAKDTYTSQVVVSDQLKNALQITGDFGLYFVRPEDLEM
ncbi:hypothetical protein AB4Y96_24455 [Phyllobacterium sp. TAF24]|uniref:hypothetical protein n=1 Tax=Phyllobacterium sp. TAF24 TaxID=3233068 RepID=UPI003F9E8FD5